MGETERSLRDLMGHRLHWGKNDTLGGISSLPLGRGLTVSRTAPMRGCVRRSAAAAAATADM